MLQDAFPSRGKVDNCAASKIHLGVQGSSLPGSGTVLFLDLGAGYTGVCSLCENLLSSTLTISVLVWHEFMLQLNVHIQKVIHSGVPYHVNFGKNTNSSSQFSGHHEKEKPF